MSPAPRPLGPLDLYPAIDLLGGRCVRLTQGNYDLRTIYSDDPAAQAKEFAAQGASWIHMVDLDAARSGEPTNRATIAAVAASVDVPVQVGGGVRDDGTANALLDKGVTRVVVGTAAMEDPAWVRRLAERWPGRVAVGLDARGRDVAVRGWLEPSGHDLVEVARSFDDSGVAALVVTEIVRDGTLAGPAMEQLSAVLEATELDVVASGGVGSLTDLRSLRELVAIRSGRAGENRERTLSGVIVGKALYEGEFDVAEALEALRK